MVNLKAIRIGDKVRIIEYNNSKYIGKTGILLRAQIPRPAIKGQQLSSLNLHRNTFKDGFWLPGSHRTHHGIKNSQ